MINMAKKTKKVARKSNKGALAKKKTKKKATKAPKSAMTSAVKRQISLRLDLGEHKRLTQAATKRGLSINSFIKMLLKEKKAA